jgi:general secretion pathway protein I
MKKRFDVPVVRVSDGKRVTDTGNGIEGGFTLIEILLALALTGGLLVTLIYTLNYQLTLTERQEKVTAATLLAKDKIADMEQNQETGKGFFEAPYEGYSFETLIKDSPYAGISEIVVIVKADGEEVKLNEFILK